MSRIKNKSRSEQEHLNGLIRQLKKQVKKLTKDNSQLRKELNKSTPKAEYFDDVEEPVKPTDRHKERCPTCNKILNAIDLGTRKLVVCNECEYRKVIR